MCCLEGIACSSDTFQPSPIDVKPTHPIEGENIKMKMRFLCMVAAVSLLAACADKPVEKAAGTAEATKPVQPQQAIKPVGIVPGSQEDFVKNVGDRVFFDYDKSALKPEGKDLLVKWVAFLKQYPNDQLLVEGHTDERGTREYNLALGEKRAAAVKDFLVANGVAAGRLKTISYGKERPAVLGSNEAAYAQNRRGVGVIQ
jgi:peptidoglycan-associated lipoprotein